jgi:hypothetical protein
MATRPGRTILIITLTLSSVVRQTGRTTWERQEMSQIDPTPARQSSSKPQPTNLPVIKRVRLPQRLRDDGWWLCLTPERPSARILTFPQNRTQAGRRERPRHD